MLTSKKERPESRKKGLYDTTTALFGKSFAKTFDGVPQGIAEKGGKCYR